MQDILSAYQELIKENIDYDSLLMTHKYDEALIQGIYELIVETVLCSNEKILIANAIDFAIKIQAEIED